MLTVTDRAVAAACRAVAEADEPTTGLRITAEPGGCHGPNYGLELDDRPEGDEQTLAFGGLTVFVTAEVLATLTGVSLDFVADGEDGGGFVFNTPRGTCGCGGQGHG
ncbi:MAG: iron-sulfur cluster assembly accessory protein [Magnetospirillum sp.]|nr:iron-sulfur cluster assembly accessory protein [Magnetospirillum sp.]